MIAVTAIAVFALLSIALEFSLRLAQFRPTIEDTSDTWALMRDGIAHNTSQKRPFVLLGRSRMAFSFSADVLERMKPEMRVFNLSKIGLCPLATLKDLAEDDDFSGTILASVEVECFLPRRMDDQLFLVKHYRNNFGWSRRFDAIITKFMQSEFVAFSRASQAPKLLSIILGNESKREANFVVWDNGRSILGDFKTIDLQEKVDVARKKRVAKYEKYGDAIYDEFWKETVININAWVTTIKNRGGNVIFIRLPTAGRVWEIDENAIPRNSYWDKIATDLNAETVHFEDIPGLEKIPLPDESHIDFRHKEIFTTAVLNELHRRGVLF